MGKTIRKKVKISLVGLRSKEIENCKNLKYDIKDGLIIFKDGSEIKYIVSVDKVVQVEFE